MKLRALAILAGLAGLAARAEPAPASPWAAFLSQFLDGYFALEPERGVAAGRHEFDGRLPDWSQSGLNRSILWFAEERAIAQSIPASSLTAEEHFERLYLMAAIRGQLFWRLTADGPHASPYYYLSSLDPAAYVSVPYAPLAVRLRAYCAYARAIPRALEELRRNLDRPVPRSLLEIGRIGIGGLAGFYRKDVPRAFQAVGDPGLRAELAAANAGAIAAVERTDAWFAEKEKTAEDRFALGPEKFRAMLRETELVDLPLDRLEAIGRRDLERNRRALEEACRSYAPGKSVRAAVALVLARKPPGSVVAFAASQLGELRRFVHERDLVTIPGTEKAEVREAPPYLRWNPAFIRIPGPYEKNLPAIYYVSPPDPSWPEAKQRAYLPSVSQLLIISAHEVYPGHFVQALHASRSPNRLARIFSSYACSEGWAHYAEEMMWEAGLGGGAPEVHIAELHEALERDVRFLAAIGLHTRGMTIGEAKRLFLEQAFEDEGNAEQQARRGAFDPGYLNYTLGKLMIRKLRDDWTATRGGRAAWKAFHDAFLGYGAAPVPLVRLAMMGKLDPAELF